jgi:ATP-dependent helicase/DNAse subunit B
MNFFSEINISRRSLSDISSFSEKKFILRWLEYFIGLEAVFFENNNYEPAFFEIKFGKGDKPPLTISDGSHKIKLGGRIDRVDLSRVEDSVVSKIVDYKTGGKVTPKSITDCYSLQLPLYMKAFGEVIMPDADVKSGIYYNLTDAEFKRNKNDISGNTIIDKDIETFMDYAAEKALFAVKNITDGNFPQPEVCSERCQWIDICREKKASGLETENAAD